MPISAKGKGQMIALLTLVVSGLSCSDSLTAPASLTSGVIIYEHPAYAGKWHLIEKNIDDLSYVPGPCFEFDDRSLVSFTRAVWNDCISSIRVAPGWRAKLYRDDEFDTDHELEVTKDISDLRSVSGPCDSGGGGFNDCVTSIKVFRPDSIFSER